MKSRKQKRTVCIAAFAMLLLILDASTAQSGVRDGLSMCMNVIIPSLFPFFILSLYINASLQGIDIPGMQFVGKRLHIPTGCESILLLGLTGGYPVGAQLVADAYREKRINKNSARIMLGYCNNAGPAFIFGMTGSLFSSSSIPFFLWGVHIFSALSTCVLLPKAESTMEQSKKTSEISIVSALKHSIQICATICGWVIAFKVLLSYFTTYLSNILSREVMICLSGLMELSNGCVQLIQIKSEAIRFILCSGFLSFGGICVMLQTASATDHLGLGLYIPGKIMQTLISIITATVLTPFLFTDVPLRFSSIFCIFVLSTAVLLMIRQYAEKRCGNFAKSHV